jgi:predicted RNA-binding protein with PUA-like domain
VARRTKSQADPSEGYWLFQCNPERFDVFAAAASADDVDDWSLARYRYRVQPGDRAVLWVSGHDAGIYAVGRVTGLPYEGSGEGNPFYSSEEEARRHRWFCPLEMDYDLFDSPIRRSELREDPRFANAYILRVPGAGNPFPLTEDEWQAVASRLPKARRKRSQPSKGRRG